jgi:hypothetical protein
MAREARADTIEEVRKRRNGGSFAGLARELGLPDNFTSTLANVFNARAGISQATENELRLALGLPAIGTEEVPVCRHHGYAHVIEDCGGHAVRIVALQPGQHVYRRGPAKRWRDMETEDLAAALRHREEYVPASESD